MIAADYVREVGYALRDLPWRQRRDLAAELQGHLAELPPDIDLCERLGAPKQFAAELRAAAGLERRRGVTAFLRAQRPRRLVLVAAAVAMLGLVIAGVVYRHERNSWVNSYQPLAFADGITYPKGTREVAGLTGEVATIHPGRPFYLGFQIINSGRVSVRVLAVPYHSLFPTLPWSARLRMAQPSYNGGVAGPYRYFHPFDLQPHQTRFLIFRGVYTCPSGSAPYEEWPLRTFPVRYSVLGHTAIAEIPFPDASLSFVFPRRMRCT
jgi:HAAS